MSSRCLFQPQLDRGCPVLKPCAVGPYCIGCEAWWKLENSHCESEELYKFRRQSRKEKKHFPVTAIWYTCSRCEDEAQLTGVYLLCSSEPVPCTVPIEHQVRMERAVMRLLSAPPCSIFSTLHDVAAQLDRRALRHRDKGMERQTTRQPRYAGLRKSHSSNYCLFIFCIL